MASGRIYLRLADICRPSDARAGTRILPLLSVTKEQGVCTQAATGRRTIGSPDLSRYKVVRRGEFAMAPMALYYGAIGRLSAVDAGVVSPAYEVFAVDESRTDAGYLEYLLRSPKLVAQYGRLAVGGNRAGKRKTTSLDAFLSIQLELPSVDEQRRIAGILAGAAQTEALSGVSLRRLLAVKRSIMARLLTTGVMRERREFVPLPHAWSVGRVERGVTSIPGDWKLARLLDVARLESGHTPSRDNPEYWGGAIPWLSLNDTDELQREVVATTKERITQAGIDNSSARILPTGTVVLTRTAVRGLASVLAIPMATSQDLVAFVCQAELDARYLVQVFRHMQPEWRRLEVGTSPTNKTIYFYDFERLEVLLPPLSEQKQIASIGDAFDAAIDAERRAATAARGVSAALTEMLLAARVGGS